jgi:hypothetical protein
VELVGESWSVCLTRDADSSPQQLPAAACALWHVDQGHPVSTQHDDATRPHMDTSQHTATYSASAGADIGPLDALLCLNATAAIDGSATRSPTADAPFTPKGSPTAAKREGLKIRIKAGQICQHSYVVPAYALATIDKVARVALHARLHAEQVCSPTKPVNLLLHTEFEPGWTSAAK